MKKQLSFFCIILVGGSLLAQSYEQSSQVADDLSPIQTLDDVSNFLDDQQLIDQQVSQSQDPVENPDDLVVASNGQQVVVLPIMIQKPDAEMVELKSSVQLKKIEYLFKLSEKKMLRNTQGNHLAKLFVYYTLILSNAWVSSSALSYFFTDSELSKWGMSLSFLNVACTALFSYIITKNVQAQTDQATADELARHKEYVEWLHMRALLEQKKTGSEESKKLVQLLAEALAFVASYTSVEF